VALMEDIWVELYDRDGPLGHKRPASTLLFVFEGGFSIHCHSADEEGVPALGLSWPGDRTIGALRAERQILTSANGTSCSACHELRSRAFLFIVSAECALPTNASLFTIFARILANAPPPHDALGTCFVCATHAHFHFCPQHWLLCHLGLY